MGLGVHPPSTSGVVIARLTSGPFRGRPRAIGLSRLGEYSVQARETLEITDPTSLDEVLRDNQANDNGTSPLVGWPTPPGVGGLFQMAHTGSPAPLASS